MAFEVIDTKIIDACTVLDDEEEMVIHPKTYRVYRQCSSDPENEQWRECCRTKDRNYITVMASSGKRPRLHNLIAKAFIPNPNNYRYVKHKDGITTNNTIENLYWSKSANPKGNPQHDLFDVANRDVHGRIQKKKAEIEPKVETASSTRKVSKKEPKIVLASEARSPTSWSEEEDDDPDFTPILRPRKGPPKSNFCQLCDCDVTNRYCPHRL
jgi:hypothetical protein